MAFTLSIPGNLGTNAGSGSDGVLIGSLTAANPDKAYLKSHALACLCISDDGGVYVNETTPANEATGDDVEIVGTTIAADDALYVGHATVKFGELRITISTQGDYTDLVLAYQYWNGSAYASLSNVTDGTTSFEAATGTVSVTFDIPEDWAKNTVDGVLAYWMRFNVTSVTASVTPCQLQQLWVVAASADATWTDDTTDFTDAGAGDVDLLPAAPVVGDGLFLTKDEKFCKIKVTTSQARTGTATLQLQYWNGSAMTEVTTYDDDSVGWSATAGTLLISFVPPADWVACTAESGPGHGQTGYCVGVVMTAITDVTQQPLATQGWVYPMLTGATGLAAPEAGTTVKASMNGLTVSGSTQDTTLLLINATLGTSADLTWTKATATVVDTATITFVQDHELVVVQVTEDGTTEVADANLLLDFRS